MTLSPLGHSKMPALPVADAPRMPESTRDHSAHFPALDGLRGIAALLVIFGHWISLGIPAERYSALYVLKRVLWLNGTGVDLFFVLSGFLIGGILIDQRGSANLLRVFWLRRAARILPLFALYLAVFAALCRWPARPLLAANTQPLWAHGAFLSNLWTTFSGKWDASLLGNTWTLAIEEQVYLLLPFVVLAFSRRVLRSVLLSVICAAPILRCLVWSWSSNDGISLAAHTFTLCRADTFAVGIFLALEFRDPRPFWQAMSLRRLLLVGAPAALVMAWMTRRNEWMGDSVFCAVGYTSCAWFYGGCVLLALTTPRLAAVFAWQPLTWIGRHSYFVYLFQGIAAALAARSALAWFGVNQLGYSGQLLLSALVLFGGATLSMRWFEAPILRWGRRHAFQPAASHA